MGDIWKEIHELLQVKFGTSLLRVVFIPKYHTQIMFFFFVYTTTYEIHPTPTNFLLSCFNSYASKLVSKFLFSSQLVQTLSYSRLTYFPYYFLGVFDSLLILESPEFHDLVQIFFVTHVTRWYFCGFGYMMIVTVNFTCRYFKIKLKYHCFQPIKLYF